MQSHADRVTRQAGTGFEFRQRIAFGMQGKQSTLLTIQRVPDAGQLCAPLRDFREFFEAGLFAGCEIGVERPASHRERGTRLAPEPVDKDPVLDAQQPAARRFERRQPIEFRIGSQQYILNEIFGVLAGTRQAHRGAIQSIEFRPDDRLESIRCSLA